MNKNPYRKTHLSFVQQADLLISRGLITNKKVLLLKLESVNYYRLSGYWYQFKEEKDDYFQPGTTINVIWNRYTFDRQFRLLIMDAIERFEISLRTKLSHQFTQKHCPFDYFNPDFFPGLSLKEHCQFLLNLTNITDSSKELFVKHYRDKYGDGYLPLWAAVENMTIGMLLTFYKGTESDIKKVVALEYGVDEKVLKSWIGCLNSVRNICAHHARLWNKTLGYKPSLPNKDPLWNSTIKVDTEKIFCVILILKYLLNIIAPQSSWPSRLENLFQQYQYLPINKEQMGIPIDWKSHPIWIMK